MKKWITLFLTFALCLALSACGGTPAATEKPEDVENIPSEPDAHSESIAGEYSYEEHLPFGDIPWTLTLTEDGGYTLATKLPTGADVVYTGNYTVDGEVVVTGTPVEDTSSIQAAFFNEDFSCPWHVNGDGTMEPVNDSTVTLPIGGAVGDLAEVGYTVWSNEAYGALEAQIFNAKLKDGPGARPVMIVVPGGAFRFVDGGRYATIAEILCEEGYLVVQLNYAVGADSYPQAIVDVKTAIQYVTDHADELHADADNITVLGCSAGGYLAAMAVFTGADEFKASDSAPNYSYQVKNLVDFFGATQWMTDALYADTGEDTAESQWIGADVSAMSSEERAVLDPLSYLNASDVTRVWVSHGTADTTMPILNSEQFYEGVKAVLGEENTHFEVIEGASHEDEAFYTIENLLRVAEFIK